MRIPKNINKEHVIKAIQKIDNEGVPESRKSTRFNLSYEGKYYPPKYVISIANIYTNGEEYSPSLFSGGEETNRFLRGLGFTIIESLPDTNINQSLNGIIYVPPLQPVQWSPDYRYYTSVLISKVIFEYLFNSRTHKWLDQNVLNAATDGYSARGVLHYIGIKKQHKGILKKLSVKDAIDQLEHQDSDFSPVIQSLQPFYMREKSQKLREIIFDDIDSEQAEEDGYYKDGAVKEYYGKRFERNPENRKKAIEIHGMCCAVCGFNYEDVYGERGKDFIEVHHVNPLSTIGEEIAIDPKNDLVPVCSNCHRMIHRRKDDVLTVEELRFLISQQK